MLSLVPFRSQGSPSHPPSPQLASELRWLIIVIIGCHVTSSLQVFCASILVRVESHRTGFDGNSSSRASRHSKETKLQVHFVKMLSTWLFCFAKSSPGNAASGNTAQAVGNQMLFFSFHLLFSVFWLDANYLQLPFVLEA